MTSVAHNGFGCPYCRTAMAKKVVREAVIPSEPDEMPPPPPHSPFDRHDRVVIQQMIELQNQRILEQNQIIERMLRTGSRTRPIVL
jgi:hypothetical protein